MRKWVGLLLTAVLFSGMMGCSSVTPAESKDSGSSQQNADDKVNVQLVIQGPGTVSRNVSYSIGDDTTTIDVTNYNAVIDQTVVELLDADRNLIASKAIPAASFGQPVNVSITLAQMVNIRYVRVNNHWTFDSQESVVVKEQALTITPGYTKINIKVGNFYGIGVLVDNGNVPSPVCITNEYSAAGTYTNNIPASLQNAQIAVELVGAGGGGGGAYLFDESGTTNSGEGGKAGQYVTATYQIIAGTPVYITVGAGGAAGSFGRYNCSPISDGLEGGLSKISFDRTNLVVVSCSVQNSVAQGVGPIDFSKVTLTANGGLGGLGGSSGSMNPAAQFSLLSPWGNGGPGASAPDGSAAPGSGGFVRIIVSGQL